MPDGLRNVSFRVRVLVHAGQHIDRLERDQSVTGCFERYPDAVQDG